MSLIRFSFREALSFLVLHILIVLQCSFWVTCPCFYHAFFWVLSGASCSLRRASGCLLHPVHCDKLFLSIEEASDPQKSTSCLRPLFFSAWSPTGFFQVRPWRDWRLLSCSQKSRFMLPLFTLMPPPRLLHSTILTLYLQPVQIPQIHRTVLQLLKTEKSAVISRSGSL